MKPAVMIWGPPLRYPVKPLRWISLDKPTPGLAYINREQLRRKPKRKKAA